MPGARPHIQCAWATPVENVSTISKYNSKRKAIGAITQSNCSFWAMIRDAATTAATDLQAGSHSRFDDVRETQLTY